MVGSEKGPHARDERELTKKATVEGTFKVGGPQLKELGQKARERLRKEIEKRPEIVRLSAVPENEKNGEDGTSKQVTAPLIPAAVDPATQGSKKRKRSMQSGTIQQKRAQISENINIDRWTPSVSFLTTVSTRKETRSRLVWLHGLPIGTTLYHIRRFFSGLEPIRIILLTRGPTYPILSWDADHSYSANQRKRQTTVVERYPPYLMRVLVRFQTPTMAEIAARRSGESLLLNEIGPHSTAPGEAGQRAEPRGAAIAVTQVTKQIATVLQAYLAVDCSDHKKCAHLPLESILNRVERQVHPLAVRVLWTAALRDLNILDALVNEDDFEFYPITKDKTRSAVFGIPAENNSRKCSEKREHRELLASDYKKLFAMSCPSLLDPEVVRIDPSLCLTAKAAKVIRKEMDRVDVDLTRVKKWQFLQPVSLSSAGPLPPAKETQPPTTTR